MDVLVYKSRHHYLENVYFQSPNNFQVHFYSISGIFSRLMGLFSKVYSITSKILMFSPNLTPNDVKPPVSRENTQPESNPQPPGRGEKSDRLVPRDEITYPSHLCCFFCTRSSEALPGSEPASWGSIGWQHRLRTKCCVRSLKKDFTFIKWQVFNE